MDAGCLAGDPQEQAMKSHCRNVGVLAVLALAAAAALSPVLAQQTPPNLIGTWKAVSPGAAVVGANPYHPGASQNEPRFTDPIEFTITIGAQKANRFTGELTDGKRTEKLIGAISPNNLGGIILDDDGQYVFTIRDLETLDVCYSHMTPASKVVACFPWTKNK
jgi:hypothetical protein